MSNQMLSKNVLKKKSFPEGSGLFFTMEKDFENQNLAKMAKVRKIYLLIFGDSNLVLQLCMRFHMKQILWQINTSQRIFRNSKSLINVSSSQKYVQI